MTIHTIHMCQVTRAYSGQLKWDQITKSLFLCLWPGTAEKRLPKQLNSFVMFYVLVLSFILILCSDSEGCWMFNRFCRAPSQGGGVFSWFLTACTITTWQKKFTLAMDIDQVELTPPISFQFYLWLPWVPRPNHLGSKSFEMSLPMQLFEQIPISCSHSVSHSLLFQLPIQVTTKLILHWTSVWNNHYKITTSPHHIVIDQQNCTNLTQMHQLCWPF